jgi:hypothetical protein
LKIPDDPLLSGDYALYDADGRLIELKRNGKLIEPVPDRHLPKWRGLRVTTISVWNPRPEDKPEEGTDDDDEESTQAPD